MKKEFIIGSLLMVAANLAMGEPKLPNFMHDNSSEDGREVGNGGDVIYCPPGTKTPGYILHDYWEGERQFDFRSDFPLAPTKDAYELARLIVARWSRFPEFQELIGQRIDAFASQAKFIRGVEMPQVPDSLHHILPVGCKLIQAAVQSEPQFPREKRYKFDQDLWAAMENAPWQRAGLILHEIFYTLDIQRNRATNSKATRYINAMFSSTDWSSLANDFIFTVFDQTDFRLINALGSIKLGELLFNFPAFHGNGNLSRGTIDFTSPHTKGQIEIGGQVIDSFSSLNIAFDEGGAIVMLNGRNQAKKIYNLPSVNGVEISTYLFGDHKFDENQLLTSGITSGPVTLNGYAGSALKVAANSIIELLPNGDLEKLAMKDMRNFEIAQPSADGRIFFLRANYVARGGHRLYFRPGNIVVRSLGSNYLEANVALFGGTSSLVAVVGDEDFHKSGVPKTIYTKEIAKLHTTAGDIREFPISTHLKIDSYGRVIVE